MKGEPDSIDDAIERLWQRRAFRHGDTTIVIACLLRHNDWRPLKAPWWRGNEVYLVGVDLLGNFLLRHSDGTVRYWNHQMQADTVLAPSVRAFVAGITEGDS
jgi:hypothetical protein